MNNNRTRIMLLLILSITFGCQNHAEKKSQQATHVLELIENETSLVTECDATLFVQNGIAFIRVAFPEGEIVTSKYTVNESNEIQFQLARHENGIPVVMQFSGTGETKLGHEGKFTVSVDGKLFEERSGRFILREKK